MDVNIFVQDQCPNCPPAKEIGKKLEKDGVSVMYHDIKSIEGLTVATMHGIMATPSIVITQGDDEEIHSWRGTVPTLDEVKQKLE